ncbi:hypothetical protein AMS68_000912 [Peltaster fructicola]|uniref:Vps72/YL1 C-terminal domain-containing protein n=1 Tax=Peltaster fructicola TaxID=286661 RepID=A0A6H0XL94_9PEZI|nr:hypothetical protein AMS68_000912 [Peltaster fructicola]
MFKIHKPFRNPNWRPPQRRNKNPRQILSEAQRAQQSLINTQQNSGASTPQPVADGTASPVLNLNPAQGSQDLSRLVVEKNAKALNGGALSSGVTNMPSVTYSSIAAAPSLKPKKKYCDITGLPAKYKDPKSGLYYYNAEVYAVVKSLSTGQVQEYLAVRGANTVLK